MMRNKKTKYIFITGGVVSSLGKGIAGASIGMLLKNQGYSVTIQKYDPYLNLDPGTMSPYQHGEVFVTEDGCETDLDLGHYERFLDQNVLRVNNVTSGMIYWDVLNKERNGDYLGHTVQIIPHVTNEIKEKMQVNDGQFDIIITEIGGTVGDIESQPFLEAIRQLDHKLKQDSLHIHLTLVPFLKTSGEYKTKPTQHSVKELRSLGIQPDVIVCRCVQPLSLEIKEKIALFCDVEPKSVVSAVDVVSIYDVPITFQEEGIDTVILEHMGLKAYPYDLSDWKKYVDIIHRDNLPKVKIAIVGKYTELSDSYISVVEALKHAGAANEVEIEIIWANSEEIEKNGAEKFLIGVDGVLVPGGFGDRGIEGKIEASHYARINNIPYFGLCLGMHIAVIEFARYVLGFEKANSYEFNKKTKYPVIHFLPGQNDKRKKGGTMRLGAYPCKILPNTLLYQMYGKTEISERHRHRYEFNNEYKKDFEAKGVVFSGLYKEGNLVEVFELPENNWYLACQFHPEFKSRLNKSHPLFKGFVAAAKEKAGLQKKLFEEKND